MSKVNLEGIGEGRMSYFVFLNVIPYREMENHIVAKIDISTKFYVMFLIETLSAEMIFHTLTLLKFQSLYHFLKFNNTHIL